MKVYWLISIPPVPMMGIDGGAFVALTELTDEESVLEEALNQGLIETDEICIANAEPADLETIAKFRLMDGGIVEL